MSKIQSISQNTAFTYPRSNRSTEKSKKLTEDERALEMLSRYQEAKEANKNNKKPVEYNGSELINRLSSARGRMDILMVISKCYKTLSELLAAASADGADTKKISRYIAHVKKIIQSAENKLSHVASEEEMERRIQHAKKQEEHERQEEALKKKKLEKRQQALKAERAERQTDELLETYRKKKKRHMNEEKKEIRKLKNTHPDNVSEVEELFSLPGTTSGSYSNLSGFTGSSTSFSQTAGTNASLTQAAGGNLSVSSAGGSSPSVSLDVIV